MMMETMERRQADGYQHDPNRVIECQQRHQDGRIAVSSGYALQKAVLNAKHLVKASQAGQPAPDESG